MDYSSQYDKIYRYCYYKVKDKNLAEDITQETFLRFLDSKYREQGKMLHYLYTIARNLCADHFRSMIHIHPIHADAELKTVGNSEFEGDVLLRHDIGRALEALSDEDKEILLLKYANEEKDIVICKLFGFSRFSLYRRLHRIKKTLSDLLPEYTVCRTRRPS